MQLTAILKAPRESKLTPTELNALKDLWVGPFWEDFCRQVEALKVQAPELKDIGPVVIPKVALVEVAMGLGHHESAKPYALEIAKRGLLHLTKSKTVRLR